MSKAKDLQQLIKTLVGSNPSPAQKKSYYFSFAFKLYEAGEKADAKNYLEEYLAIKTQDVKGYNLLGQIYEELNCPNDAIKAYNRSLSIDDSQIRLMLKLSTLYLQVKNIAEANFWLDRAEIKANNDEKAEIIQNRIEILKLSNGSKVFEQAAAGLNLYPKHLGINIQYLEALEARESYFSIFQHFEKCNRYFETNIRWWEWGLHFLSRLIQKHKEKQRDDAMDDDSDQTVQMHEIVLAWMHFADRYTKLFIDSNFYTLSMVKCKEFEDLVRSARENPPAQLDEDDEQYWTYAIDEYAARIDKHYASTFIREASQTTSSEEQTTALREAFARLNKCFNNYPAESKMSTLQRRSEVGKQLWSLINTYNGHLDEEQLASFDVDALLNSTKSLDLQILSSTPEYADNIDSVLRVCGFYHENKLHDVIEEIFNALFGADLPKIDTNIYREMSSPHVVDFITYFYVTLLTPATNANDPLWRDSRKAIRILSSKKKLDAPWTKHEDLPSVTSIAHWIDKIRIGPSDNPSLYFLTKLYGGRCTQPETELQKEFSSVYEKYTINLGKKLVKQLRQLLETRVNNSIVQSDKQAMLDESRNILETLAKRALKINDYTKAMACVNNLGTSSSYLLLIELSLSQFQSSQRKEFLQRAEQYLKRSSDFSFTKEEEQKKLEQLRNELHELRGDPMELENASLTPMTPSTPSVFDTQPFISPAVDMTHTASAKRRREQQLSDLKKLRSEALQLSSSKGSVTPSTPSTPSMFNIPAKKHESPPPARKLDFGGDLTFTPETKPASQINLFGTNTNVANTAAKPTTAPTPATLPTPNRIQFITSPTVPVVNTPSKPSIPTAVINTSVPIPSPPKESYKDKDEDSSDRDEDSKPQKKKRQLSDTDLDPQKKASLISATTNFPPIPTKIVSPNIVQPKTSPAKPSRAEVLRNAQSFDFGAPSVPVTPVTAAPSSNASPFSFGAPTTDTKTASSTTAPFSFGAPTTDTKTGSSTAVPFGFGTPAADNKTTSSTASPFGFGTPPTDNKTGSTAGGFGFGAPSTDKASTFGFTGTPAATASPFTFGPPPPANDWLQPKKDQQAAPKPEEKKNESTTASPFTFGPPKPAEEKKPGTTATTLVDNSSPFNFNASKPGSVPQTFDFGSAKQSNQSPTQSTLGSSVKSEMSASELMKSDRSVESAGWREERGSHFGSERNELFKETMSPSSSQRSEDQDPSEDKSGETDSEREEEDEEHEESEESYHSDDSDGWFTGPIPKSKQQRESDEPLTSTPTKPDNKPKVQPTTAAPPKVNIAPQFNFGATPSFGVQDKPKEEKKAEIPAISFGSPTNKSKDEKRPESPAPVFSFSPRQLDKTEEKKPETGFGFGFGSAPTFAFGEPQAKTPELPAASPKLSFESFTPKLDPEQPGEGFNGVPAFSLGGKPADEKKPEEKPSTTFSFPGFGTPASDKPKAEENPTETKPDEKKPEEKSTFSFPGFGTPAGDKTKAEEKPVEKKTETGFGFGATTPAFNFGFGTSEKPKEEKKDDNNNTTTSTTFGFGTSSTPSFSFGQTAPSEEPKDASKPEAQVEKVEPKTDEADVDSEDESEDGSDEAQESEDKETVEVEERPKDEAKPEEKKTETTPSAGFGFGFGGTPSFGTATTPSFSFGQPAAEPKTEEKNPEATKDEEKKPESAPTTGFGFGFGGTPSFGTTTPSFSFGQPAAETKAEETKPVETKTEPKSDEETKPEEPKTEERKPESAPTTGFGFGFGGTPSFGATTTPAFAFGQPATEPKAEEKKAETETQTEEKKPEENKPEEKKPESAPTTGFGFGFGGTPSFGTTNTPSFSFGQPAAEPKAEEKKPEETKPEEKKPETEAPKFDLSALGAATFKFGQTEEKKPETQEKKQIEVAQPSSFGFSFGGGLLEKDKAAQEKPSKHLKDPMKPIPNDSDDDTDSDSDDDKPVKPKNTSTTDTSSSTSYSFAPSSFAFAPSSFSVPATEAPKQEEQPKFEFTIQFGESSMTKRLGSDFGLTDNKMSTANDTNINNLASSGTGFGVGSSDKIFGQVSAAPLTTFSALNKSEDKKEEDDKADTKHEDKIEKDETPEPKDDKSETNESKEEKPEDKAEESSVNDSVVSESEESKSVNQSVNDSVSESVNTTIEASHDEGSDSDPASASDDDAHEDDSDVTEAINEKHTTTLSHFQRVAGPKGRRKPSHPPAVEKKEEAEHEVENENKPTESSVDEDEPKDEPEEASPVKPKLGFGFALPGMAPGFDLRSVLKKKNQTEEKQVEQPADEPKDNVEEKDDTNNTNQQAEPVEEPKADSTEDKSEEKSAVESVPSDVPSLVSDSHVEDSLNKDIGDSVRSDESQSELGVSVLEGSNMSVESTGWKQAERGSHFGSEHDNPLFASTFMSPPGSIVSSQIDEAKDEDKPAEQEHDKPEEKEPEVQPVEEKADTGSVDQPSEPAEEQKSGDAEEKSEHAEEQSSDEPKGETTEEKTPEDKTESDKSGDTEHETKGEEKPQEDAKVEVKPEEKKEEQKPFAFNFPSPNTSTDTSAAPQQKLSFDFTGFANTTPSFGFGAPQQQQDSSTPATGFGLGFGSTPAFSFGQTKPEDKPKEETKPEEKKPETSSTGFGFGFGAPSFGSTPSFSFGQTTDPAKKEEPKQDEKPEEKKFDLSALGAATFKFGQTEEKKPETPAPTPSFNFGFGTPSTNTGSPFSMNLGGALGTPATQQPKQSTQTKPQKKSRDPIPNDSDDEDSDSDDDKPVKPKNTSTTDTSSSTSYSFAPSSFAFAPSSFSVPATEAPKQEEQPKFEFTIQFGESSMTKRLGSDFGLTDNKMSTANTNNNLASSGSGFSFGSSDKIFGQSSTAPLTTFSALNKSEDKEKSDQDDKKEDNEHKPE